MGGKSYDMEHQVVSYRDHQPKIAAHGAIVLVMFDFHANQSIVVPDEWRAKIAAYEPNFNQ